MDTFYNDLVAMEAGLSYVAETSLMALDCECVAMEGINKDAWNARRATLKQVKAISSEMKAAAKEGDYKTAASKARECASKFDELSQFINGLDQSAGSAALIDIALALASLVAIAAAAFGIAKAGKAIGSKVGEKVGSNKGLKALSEGGDKIKGKSADAARSAMGEIAEQHAKAYDKSNQKMFKNLYRNSKDPSQRKQIMQQFGEYNKRDRAGIMKARKSEVMHGYKAGTPSDAQKLYRENLGDAMKAAGTVGKAAGASMGKKAGAFAGAGIASTAVGSFLAKKGLIGKNGKGRKELQPNDVNALLNACRKTCADGKKRYTELAQMYDQMASAS